MMVEPPAGRFFYLVIMKDISLNLNCGLLVKKQIMKQVTAGDRSFSSFLCGVAILVVLVNMMFVSNHNTLIGLVALLFLLLLFLFYNINFIQLWISGDKIALTKFKKNISYVKIQKLRVLPVSAKRIRGYSTICIIKYINASGKTITKLLDVPADKSQLLDEVRKMIGHR
jgi:hypothetical protein